MKRWISSRRRGLSLVETVFSMGLLLLAGLGMVAAIIYTRHMMELNKQTLTAMNYARQILEWAGTNGSIDKMDNIVVLHFNDPGMEIPAEVLLRYYPIDEDGLVDWSTHTAAPRPGEPMYCRVVLRWDSTGSMGRQRNVTMSTIVRAGTL